MNMQVRVDEDVEKNEKDYRALGRDLGLMFHFSDGKSQFGKWFVDNDILRSIKLSDGPIRIGTCTPYWFDMGADRTFEVLAWMSRMNIPPFEEWTDHERTLLALRFT